MEGGKGKFYLLLQELPALLSSDDEREILALMCRVHELEADKMALQSERLVRQHELRRRDLVILRYDRQRQLCEEIITRQRQLMEGMWVFFFANCQTEMFLNFQMDE